jgi:Tol biopolymer transport system component
VSPIRSELLISSSTGEAGFLAHGPTPLWIVRVPAGSPRLVGNLSAGVAAWSRDGQLLAYTLDRDVNLAKWDGTQSHKLVTVAGQSSDLQFSPDGKQLRLTARDSDGSLRLWEVGVNGKGLRSLLPDSFHQAPGECCGKWSADGRYYFFVTLHNGRSDIWAIRERSGFFRRGSHDPSAITTGPLAYFSPAPALAGDRLFVIGEQQRVQLQRLDPKSQQFVPFLDGISAGEIDFSRDSKWVTYVSYPDYLLWRSRSDGSEKLQLTSGPVPISMPRWSPNGTHIAYLSVPLGKSPKVCIVSADGGASEEVQLDKKDWPDDPQWAPDGKSLLLALYPPGGRRSCSGTSRLFNSICKPGKSALSPVGRGCLHHAGPLMDATSQLSPLTPGR